MAALEQAVIGFPVAIDVPEVPKEAAPPWQHKFRNMISRWVEAVLAILVASNPVFDILEELELGKYILGLAISMVIGLFNLYKQVNAQVLTQVLAIFLSVGAALTFNGILLKKIFRRGYKWIEVFGVVLILAAFFSLAAFLVSGILVLIPAFSFVLCLLPFVIAIFCRRQGDLTAPNDDGEHGQLMPPSQPV